MLSVQQLLDRLDDRFRLLDTGSRTVLPRHRTLRALIDWSHALCTEQERLLWARASVFSGGMDLEAAEAVCSGDGIARDEVFDVIAALMDKSVLIREENALGTRYRLLETTRQYGRDRLAESGEEAKLQRRHRDFYRLLCAETSARFFGPFQVALLTRLKLENANLRSALDYCFDTPGEAGIGLKMAAALLYHWIAGYLHEGRRRLEQSLAAVPEPTRARARGLVVTSWLALIQGEAGPATAFLDEAHAIGERLDDAQILADVALHRGLVAIDRAETDTAIGLCEEAVARHRRTGDPAGLALALMWLVAALTQHGELDDAVRVGEEGIALCDAHGECLHRAYMATMLGIALWRQGGTRRAASLARESLAFQRSLGNPRGIAISLSLLGWVAVAEGRYEKAGRILGILRTFSQNPGSRSAIGVSISGYRHLAPYQDECKAELRRAVGEDDLDAAINLGARLSADEGLAYALRDDSGEQTARGRPASLTRRENQVAGLVARGMSNRQIAAELAISQRTIEGHVKHILDKLSFSSRTQIATWVEEQEGGAKPPPGVLPSEN